MKQAKIFLADERDVTETECFRSYNTFNFGEYYNQHKTDVEKLYVCKEDTLAGGKNFTATATLATQVVILPVVGTTSPIMALNSVDLPAPFMPMTPVKER